jgi:hypothetical protein
MKNAVRKRPATKRHNSRQDHPTPAEFICAIEGRFDLIGIDLAGTKRDHVTARFISPKENSLKQDWAALLKGKLGYLNPPFDPITPWVEKSIAEALKGTRFVMLSRASVDSNWFWKMFPYCTVYALKSRIKFVGSRDTFPEPLILSAFNCMAIPGPTIESVGCGRLHRWNWKLDATR